MSGQAQLAFVIDADPPVRRVVGQSEDAGQAATELDEVRRRAAPLSVPVREVMELVVRGQLNKQIATALGLTRGPSRFTAGG